MIDNPTSCDKIMCSTLMCFHIIKKRKKSSLVSIFDFFSSGTPYKKIDLV
jgi:hypothetical protein